SVDVAAKSLVVKDLKTGEESTDTFDKLVVTTGSAPVIPPIDGIDNKNVMLCKNFAHAKALKDIAPHIKSAVVIGSGYIGDEIAEQYALTGKEVNLVDALPRVLAKNFDKVITDRVQKDYEDHGVKVQLGEKVVGFSGDDQVTVKTDKGSYT